MLLFVFIFAIVIILRYLGNTPQIFEFLFIFFPKFSFLYSPRNLSINHFWHILVVTWIINTDIVVCKLIFSFFWIQFR
jgi:hypothetical protein